MSTRPELEATTSLAHTKEDVEQVVRDARLRTVVLLRSEFKQAAAAEPKGPVEFAFSRRVSCHDIKEGESHTVFAWSARATSPEGEDLFECSADWLVQYAGISECNRSALYDFIQRVGTMTTYPYFRALAAHLCWAGLVELPPLPVITVGTFPVQPLSSAEHAVRPKRPARASVGPRSKPKQRSRKQA